MLFTTKLCKDCTIHSQRAETMSYDPIIRNKWEISKMRFEKEHGEKSKQIGRSIVGKEIQYIFSNEENLRKWILKPKIGILKPYWDEKGVLHFLLSTIHAVQKNQFDISNLIFSLGSVCIGVDLKSNDLRIKNWTVNYYKWRERR